MKRVSVDIFRLVIEGVVNLCKFDDYLCLRYLGL